MNPNKTIPSASHAASRGTDYDGFLRASPDHRVHRADIPRQQVERMHTRNRFLDRSTEGRDADFVATRGSTTRAIKRMIWSRMLNEHVWWARQPSGKWEPTGARERAVIRKLRVELSDAHNGESVEEVLDAMSAEELREAALEANPNADL